MSNKKTNKVFFRADGNSKIGLGHVIRSLALAKVINKYYETFFIIREPSHELLTSIKSICRYVIELNGCLSYEAEAIELSEMFKKDLNSIFVLDGYHFDNKYQEVLKNFGYKLVSIDDIHSCHFISDVIINHAISAKRSDYSAESYTKFYLGLDYALLRPLFLKHANLRNKDSFQWNNNIFISLGGADPNNDLLNLLSVIKDLKGYEMIHFKVVVGSAYVFYDDLISQSWLNEKNISIYRGISESEMLELMKSCSTAICSPSSVAIEFMAVGGLLFLHCIADNQQEFFKSALEYNIAFSFENFPSNFNSELAIEMYLKHCELIDGHQKIRFLSIFNQMFNGIKC